MTLWTFGDVLAVGIMRGQGWSIQSMCDLLAYRTRDELIECIDALLRSRTTHEALRHLNSVLTLQDGGFPLINGKPAWVVEKASRPAPMFTS